MVLVMGINDGKVVHLLEVVPIDDVGVARTNVPKLKLVLVLQGDLVNVDARQILVLKQFK